MNGEEFVSIIMPNYNGERYLKRSIESVLNQTFSNFEFIIVDDASTDHSREIIDQYKDSRIKKKFLERNRHVSNAANEGLAIASGDFVARIDSDDIWEKNKLEKQIHFMREHPQIGGCFTRVHIIDDDSNMVDAELWELCGLFNNAQNRTQREWAQYFFYHGNCLCHSSSLLRKEALDRIGRYYNLAYVTAEDFELWCRLVLKYPIYILEDPLTYYRWTERENKISKLNSSGEVAFENVHAAIMSDYLDLMEKDEFIALFGDLFINKASCSEIELACEKMFLLLYEFHRTGNINYFGIKKAERILRADGGLEMLEKNYSFNLKEFYKELRNRNFFSYDVAEEIRQLQGKNEEADARIEQQSQQIFAVNNRLQVIEQKIREKEKIIEESQAENEILEKEIRKQEALIDTRQKEIQELEKIINEQKENLESELKKKNELLVEIEHLEAEKDRQCKELHAITNSLSWRMTAPVRVVCDFLVRIVRFLRK